MLHLLKSLNVLIVLLCQITTVVLGTTHFILTPVLMGTLEV